jgi:signal transduction histidine kinase
MSGASSLVRKKRDRPSRSQPPKRTSGTEFSAAPLERLAAAYEACRAILGERPTAVALPELLARLREIFQAEVAVLRVSEPCALEAVSPSGIDPQGWANLLETPRSSAPSIAGSRVVEPEPRVATLGIEHIVVVPLSSTRLGTLLLAYERTTAPATSGELVMFDLLGDYLGLTLHQAIAPNLSSEASATSTDDLVSQAAHDLRTPLTPISMLLQTLERKAAVGAVDVDGIQRARRQVQRLTDMITDLIDLARLREGRLLLEPAVTDLRDAVARAGKAFGERDRRRAVELVLGDEPLWIVADADRTVHAIASLFDHVARLSQGEAPLRARLARRDAHASLEIHSERPVTNASVRLELGASPSGAVHRVPPLGLGVRLADLLFARLGGKLQVADSRDGCARIDSTFPLSPPPSSARTVG